MRANTARGTCGAMPAVRTSTCGFPRAGSVTGSSAASPTIRRAACCCRRRAGGERFGDRASRGRLLSRDDRPAGDGPVGRRTSARARSEPLRLCGVAATGVRRASNTAGLPIRRARRVASVRTIIQAFNRRKVLGCSPSAEIRRQHIQVAKRLLSDTDLPIPDVAAASGFGSATYFAYLSSARPG